MLEFLDFFIFVISIILCLRVLVIFIVALVIGVVVVNVQIYWLVLLLSYYCCLRVKFRTFLNIYSILLFFFIRRWLSWLLLRLNCWILIIGLIIGIFLLRILLLLLFLLFLRNFSRILILNSLLSIYVFTCTFLRNFQFLVCLIDVAVAGLGWSAIRLLNQF